MRPASFVAAAALLLAVTVMQSTVEAPPSQAEDTSTPATIDCAQEMGAAAPGERCSQPSPGGTPALVISHTVLAGACAGSDLHVVRYVPAGRGPDAAAVATYCG